MSVNNNKFKSRKMEKKLITVITASFNAADTIERTILSVICQKKDDIEYIIADGASRDETMSVINRYREKIDHVISEHDNGVYDAWNKALKYAHGEWIIFLGADDFYEPDTFDTFRDFINSYDTANVDLISAKCRLINYKGKELRTFGKAYNWELFRNGNNCLAHGATLHNVKLFAELGRYDIHFNINADFEFLLRRKMNGLFIDKVLLNMQEGGISYSANGLIQCYRIKRYRKSSDTVHDIYYLIKGLTGFYLRKFFWDITK